MRRLLAAVALLAGLGAGVCGPVPPASALAFWTRPVPGPEARPFRAPLTRFGAGHLWVDLVAAPGTPVVAAGAGTVVFAGEVAGTRHVVIRHAGGLRTSYSFVASVRVHAGQVVERGAVIATTGGRGEGHDGSVLHLGLRTGDTYVDPMLLFRPPDLAAIVHLAATGDPVPAAGPAGPRMGAERVALGRSLALPARAVSAVLPAAVPAADPSATVASGRRTLAGVRLFPR